MIDRSAFPASLAALLIGLALVAPRAGATDPAADGLYADFITSAGNFRARLEFERAPRTVANFVSLAEGTRNWIDFPQARLARRPFYDGLTFHRVIAGFMLQGGSRNGQGTDGPGFRFADEFHPELRHARPGILSMANSGRNSNGAQFFVTVTNTPWLDDGHSVFGEVVEGMDLVHQLSKVPTGANDRPVQPLLLESVRIVRVGPAAQAFDPARVTPPLPEVSAAACALELSPTTLGILLQPAPNRTQHVFFSTDFREWFVNSFGPTVSNLTANGLRNEPQGFIRVLDGGFEP